MISPKKLTEALDKSCKFNPNMQLVARLYQLLQDPDADLEDVSKLISTDGAMTAQIIRLCNSTYYSPASRIVDLYDALQQVGIQETLRLVGSIISKQLFMRDLCEYGITSDEYWANSYYCALFMEACAKPAKIDPSLAYLTGLLHAIGKVVINEILLDEPVDILWGPAIATEKWEKIMTGYTHAEQGAILLKRWNMPEVICDVVKNQRQFIEDPSPLAELLKFSRTMAEVNQWDFSDDSWFIPEDEDFHNSCSIEFDEVENIHKEVLVRVRELYKFVSKS